MITMLKMRKIIENEEDNAKILTPQRFVNPLDTYPPGHHVLITYYALDAFVFEGISFNWSYIW